MFTLDKYRLYDYIHIQGVDAEIFKENEQGELINPINYKDFSYFRAVSTIAGDLTVLHNNEYIATSEWFVTMMNDKFYFHRPVKITDFQICGETIQFWNQENANGDSNKNGEYSVLYAVTVKINNIQMDENDLQYLFAEMEW